MHSPKNVRWQFTTSINAVLRLLPTACVPFRMVYAQPRTWEEGFHK